MNLFKPSDFVLIANRGQNSAIEIAEASNRILNEWLAKAKEVERECEHKNVGLMMEKKGFRCVDCSAEIKPKKGWERA